MATFAQVDHGLVTGLLSADTAPTELPPGRTFVEIPDGTVVVELSRYVDGAFLPPVPPPQSQKTSKTALLAALGPDLVAAWFASTDPILVFGREMFKADTSVNLSSAVITQVLAQGVALGLVKPDAAAAVQAAITALPPA